jgi:AraC-like DNA-binding protein
MVTWIGKILKDEYRKGTQLIDMEVLDQPLVVLTYAKMIHDLEEDNSIIIPEGRKDYQILYIKKGFLEYYEGDKVNVYGKNTMFIIRPGVPQRRRVVASDEKFICLYVHFSGSEVEKYLKDYNLNETIYEFNEGFEIFEEIYNRMEAGKNSAHHQELCTLLLQELFIHISDGLKQKQCMFKKGFSNLLAFMEETCTKNYPVSFYAEQIRFSEVYFIRFFKKAMGVSPHKYLINKKLEKSIPLLLYSKESIKSISEKLGFSNQHYFSKVFYDKYKVPPSEYRNK